METSRENETFKFSNEEYLRKKYKPVLPFETNLETLKHVIETPRSSFSGQTSAPVTIPQPPRVASPQKVIPVTLTNVTPGKRRGRPPKIKPTDEIPKPENIESGMKPLDLSSMGVYSSEPTSEILESEPVVLSKPKPVTIISKFAGRDVEKIDKPLDTGSHIKNVNLDGIEVRLLDLRSPIKRTDIPSAPALKIRLPQSNTQIDIKRLETPRKKPMISTVKKVNIQQEKLKGVNIEKLKESKGRAHGKTSDKYNLREIQNIARELGIKTGNRGKDVLIGEILDIYDTL